MGILEKINAAKDLDTKEDRVGGGSYVLSSDVYDMNINLAYLDQSQGGAIALWMDMSTADNQNLKSIIYFTSGNEKGNKNYFIDKDGNQKPLPGFSRCEELCEIVTGKGILQQDTATKTVKGLFDDKPVEKEVIQALMGETVKVCVMQNEEDKYNAPGETVMRNEIVKALHTDGRTQTEKDGGAESEFLAKWLDKWQGEINSKVKNAGNTAAKSNGAAKSGGPSLVFKKDQLN